MNFVRTGSTTCDLMTHDGMRYAVHGDFAAGTECAFSLVVHHVVAHVSDTLPGPGILPPAVSMSMSWRNNHLCRASGAQTSDLKTLLVMSRKVHLAKNYQYVQGGVPCHSYDEDGEVERSSRCPLPHDVDRRSAPLLEADVPAKTSIRRDNTGHHRLSAL